MGRWMCQHLMTKGYAATVYNRTKDKAQPLLERAPTWADTPKAVAERSRRGLRHRRLSARTCAKCSSARRARWPAARPGTVLVDMTTSEPSLAQEIYDRGQGEGRRRLDAPVSRRRRRREERGPVDHDRRRQGGGRGGQAVVRVHGQDHRPPGRAGAGQHTKMVNQILIASNMIGVCEALAVRLQGGAGPGNGDAIGLASARRAARSLEVLGPRIMARNFEPGFFVEHFIKDMGIALDEAQKMGLALPGLALAKQLYLAVQAQGYGRKGTQALMLALEHLSNVQR